MPSEGKDATNAVHYESDMVVRWAIAELGGTMPENLPAGETRLVLPASAA
jgi:hypothetical protein